MGVKDRIIERRDALGLTNASLARKAGVNATYIRDLLETHDPNPRMRQFEMVAEALGVNAHWLWTGEEPGKIEQLWDRLSERRRKLLFPLIEEEANRSDSDEG